MSRLTVALVAALGASSYGCDSSGSSSAPAPTRPPEPDVPMADVKQPKDLTRAAFSVRYPGNWSIDPAGNLDRLFSIDSPGSCHVQIAVLDQRIESRTLVDTQVKALDGTVMTPALRRDPTARWGASEGEGAEVKGKASGTPPLTVRIFGRAGTPRSFVVVEYCYDDDLPHVEPGFELVRSTFRLL